MIFGTDKQVIVAECEGCAHVTTRGEAKFCDAYNNPAAKWMAGACNLGTHVQRKLGGDVKKVNPLKASKKAAKGKG